MTEYEKFLERKTKEYGDRFVEPWGAEKFARFLHDPTRIRVRTTYPSGDVEERTGTVGITTGWRPAFLLMHRSNDSGSWDIIDERDEITAVRWNGHDYEPVSGPAYKAIDRSPTTPAADQEPVSQAVFQDVSAPENPTPGCLPPLGERVLDEATLAEYDDADPDWDLVNPAGCPVDMITDAEKRQAAHQRSAGITPYIDTLKLNKQCACESTPAVTLVPFDTWRCSKCGTLNQKGQIVCSNYDQHADACLPGGSLFSKETRPA